jgi:hypothetical protein
MKMEAEPVCKLILVKEKRVQEFVTLSDCGHFFSRKRCKPEEVSNHLMGIINCSSLRRHFLVVTFCFSIINAKKTKSFFSLFLRQSDVQLADAEKN